MQGEIRRFTCDENCFAAGNLLQKVSDMDHRSPGQQMPASGDGRVTMFLHATAQRARVEQIGIMFTALGYSAWVKWNTAICDS